MPEALRQQVEVVAPFLAAKATPASVFIAPAARPASVDAAPLISPTSRTWAERLVVLVNCESVVLSSSYGVELIETVDGIHDVRLRSGCVAGLFCWWPVGPVEVSP